MGFNERQFDEFGLAYMAVVCNRLKHTIRLNWFGLVLTVIVVIGINLSFMM
jgi:hypothetical protein